MKSRSIITIVVTLALMYFFFKKDRDAGPKFTEEEVEETTTSLENIEKATSVIQDKVTKLRFEDCVVTGLTQKATTTKVTVNSADFEVTVTIKDNERWGL